MIVEYNSKNAIEFFKYSNIYPKCEIKKYVQNLYCDCYYYLGIEQDDKPIGFMAIERRGKRAHVCYCFFVEKKHRGRGIARKLFAAALKKAKSEGVREFYISFFENRDWSDTARQLYTREGFEESGYIRQTFVIDMTELKKSIDVLKGRYLRYLSLNAQYSLKTFADMTEKERSRIKEQLGTSIPYNFNPLITQADPKTSELILDKTNPVAWLVFTKNTSNALYLHHLYVKEAYRNRGFFLSLFCSAFDNAPENIKRCFFYINSDNQKSLGLLKLFKYSEIKHDKMIEMVKRL